MSKEHIRKELHKRCNACDFQKLKQLENNPIIRKIRDKIEQLNFKLTECKNENQMLKRNLQLAKKMVCQEVGGEEIDFQTLLKYGTESGSKGRQENVIILKTKVQELKDYLKELEGDSPTSQETPSEEAARNQMPIDRKKLWRLELERRLARENAEKDINPLVQECVKLRRSLDSEKCHFRELGEEVKLLRTELQSQVEKNEEDFGIVNSFKNLEKQLEETLTERADIRNELDGSRSRNKRLSEEVANLKEQLQSLQKKTSDNNRVIDSLTSSHKQIQEAIDFEKAIVQQNVERYQEELKGLQENQVTDFEILDHLQCIIHDRHTLIDELEDDLKSRVMIKNEKKKTIANKKLKVPVREPETVQSSASKNKIAQRGSTNPTDQGIPVKTGKDGPPPAVESGIEDPVQLEKELKVRKLRLECAKYKALCEAAKMEGDRLSFLIIHQDKKMTEIAVQVVETGRLIMQKNAEKKEILEKVNKLQRSLSARRRRGKFHGQTKSRLEELRIKSDAQKEENDFLRNFLRSAVCSKAKDLEQFKGFIADSKHFLDACLSEIKELLESPPSPEQNDLPPPVEPED